VNAKSRTTAVHVLSAAEIEAARRRLSAADPVLAIAHAEVAPFEWRIRDAGFIGLVQLICEQQVSVASAAAIWKRLQQGVGTVTAENVSTFDVETLRTFGLSRPKAVYVRALADAESSGAIDFGRLRDLDDEAAIEALTALKGIGRWTAEVYLMFCEGRTDLFPAKDLALQESYRWAARTPARPTEKELSERARRWQPDRGIAAHLLWCYYRAIKAGTIPAPEITR